MRPVLSFALLLLTLPLGAEEATVPEAERAQVLQRVAEQCAGIRDLTADFEQRSLREGLTEPVVSRGTLRYRVDAEAGAELLLTITEPEKSFIRVTRLRMETYLPEDGQVEIIDLKEDEAGARAVDATVLLYGKSREYWEAHFDVAVPAKASADAPDELRLVPKDEDLRRQILEIRMWVAPETALPVRVRYRYARGEEVTMDFGRVKPNTGLKARDLALAYPKDTEILRPGGEPEQP